MTKPIDYKTGSRLTPMSEAYQTCERTCAEVRIYSGAMHPRKVTEFLGLAPTGQAAIGETSAPNSLGLTNAGKINGWFLSSEGHVESNDVRHHLDWLLAKLEPKGEALRQLQEYPGIRMSVNCPWWSRYGDGGPTLWPEQMRTLAALNLECSFDFAYYGPDRASQSDQRVVPQS
jgi:hypothetical protein